MRPVCRAARLLALLAVLGTVEIASAQETASALDPRVLEHRRAMTLKDGKLEGPGAEWLRDRAAEARFFMLGEQHATADIARLATAMFREYHGLGYRYAAIEIGPWSTPIMEDLLRAKDGAFERYLRESGNPLVFPFFFFAEEAEFAREVIRRTDGEKGVLWGVDQEFIAGAQPLLEKLLAPWATTDEQRAAVAAALEVSGTNPMLLGSGDPAVWQRLTEAFREGARPEARELLEEIVVSRRIYSPFVGKGGSVYLANHEREHYMKTWFHRHLEEAETRLGDLPRVFFKFGANHVASGLSPTHVLTLGTFARELAWARGLPSFNVHVDCAGGEVRDPRSGGTSPCTSYFLAGDSTIGTFLLDGKWTVIDLAGLRAHRDLWSTWDESSQRLLWAFDAYVVVRDPTAATPIAP